MYIINLRNKPKRNNKGKYYNNLKKLSSMLEAFYSASEILHYYIYVSVSTS